MLCLLVLLIPLFVQAGEIYQPHTGDSELDQFLRLIYQRNQLEKPAQREKHIQTLAQEFQIPREKVAELFSVYEFNPADVLITVSIADVSGEPLKNISGLYARNRKKGWKYVPGHL